MTQAMRRGKRNALDTADFAAVVLLRAGAMDAGPLSVEIVKTCFKLKDEKKQQVSGNADGKARDIDVRIGFVARQCVQSSGQVTFEHKNNLAGDAMTARGERLFVSCFFVQNIFDSFMQSIPLLVGGGHKFLRMPLRRFNSMMMFVTIQHS